MPRIGPLLELSREHHSSLVMARDARRAAANRQDVAAVAAMLARAESHWRTLLAGHFDREEQLMRSMESALDPEAVARVLAEHVELRMLASGPSALDPIARLARFGDLLAAHVRYEERVVFPQVQLHLDAADGVQVRAPESGDSSGPHHSSTGRQDP